MLEPDLLSPVMLDHSETVQAVKGGLDHMQLQSWKRRKTHISSSLNLKRGGILLLLMLCTLIVACGNSNTPQVGPGNPTAVPTINLNEADSSPTPPLPHYLCGAWVTNTSPVLQSNTVISVLAKFVHIVGGNPVGVDGATGTAQIEWPDGTSDVVTATTTPDGLAVFRVVLKKSSLGKIVLVLVTFSKEGIPPCTVPQPAYFTPVNCAAAAKSAKHCPHN